MAILLAKETNKSNAALSSIKNNVKVYRTEVDGHTVINYKQELTKTTSQLLNIKDKYINMYQVLCPYLKPVMNDGVLIKNNIYDRDNNLVFSFYLQCE